MDSAMNDPQHGALSPLRRFYFEYGFLLDAFTGFDALIEVLLKQQLRLTDEETSITFSSVGFGAKLHILCSLLARNPQNGDKVILLNRANDAAGRNGFAHGFIIPDEQLRNFTLVRREVKNRYKLTERMMTHEIMQSHAKAFYDLVLQLYFAFGVTENDVLSYQKSLVENAPKPEVEVGKQRHEELDAQS
jgi:hypothetical protein